MGVLRKVISINTVGLVDFKSDKERTANSTRRGMKATKKTNKLLKEQNKILREQR